MSNNYIDEELYQTIVKNVVTSCVDIVVFSNDMKRVLLFKRLKEPAKGVYYTPGGRLNKDEKPMDCAIRKIKGELGINVDKKRLLFSGVIYENFNNSHFSEEVTANFLNIFYSYQLSQTEEVNFEQDLKLDDQHEAFKWFDINDNSIHQFVKRKIYLCLCKEKQEDI